MALLADAQQSARGHSRALSVLFDIELDDTALDASSCERLRELLASGRTQAQRELLRDAEQAREIALHSDEAVDLHAFAEVLASRGHACWLRTGKPGGDGGSPVAFLRHTFVVAAAGGASAQQQQQQQSPQLFVVEPALADHFALPNATPSYQLLHSHLPSLYVGTAEQLAAVVELMCAQMQVVFAETATSCPPWRQLACMLSKWLPASADDVPVPPPHEGSDASVGGGGGSCAGSGSADNNEAAGRAPALQRAGSCDMAVAAAGDPALAGNDNNASPVAGADGRAVVCFTGGGGGASLLLAPEAAEPCAGPGAPGLHSGGGSIDFARAGRVLVRVGSGSPGSSGTPLACSLAASLRGPAAPVDIRRPSDASACSAAASLHRAGSGVAAAPQPQAHAQPQAAGAQLSPRAAHAPLDISRFDSEELLFSPRAAKAQAQAFPHVPVKRRAAGAGGPCSALSAAIAGQPVGGLR